MYGRANISIICTPQVLNWTLYLWLRVYARKKRKKNERGAKGRALHLAALLLHHLMESGC